MADGKTITSRRDAFARFAQLARLAALALFFPYLAIVIALTLARPDELPSLGFEINDKLQHLAAYAIGAGLAFAAFRRLWMSALGLLALGLGLELAQAAMRAGRQAEAADMAANAAGVALGLSLAFGVLALLSALRRRLR